MVEVIFHIGMGKTGTSSIQSSLTHNREALRRDFDVDYLGLWFDVITPDYSSYEGQAVFLSLPSEPMQAEAEKFYTALLERSADGATRFVLSNEAIYGYPDTFSEFCRYLAKLCQVTVLCYARHPYDWLQSAYVQWGIVHKANKGPLLSYEEYARKQIVSYAALVRWSQLANGYRFCLRPHAKGTDVVDDFAGTIGIAFEHRPRRFLERVSPVDLALRAAFNGQSDEQVLPLEFDAAFAALSSPNRFSLKDLVDRSLDYRATEAIVADNLPIFHAVRDTLGVDLLAMNVPQVSPPDVGHLRDGVVDALVQQVTAQARMLRAFEARIKALEARLEG